MGATVCEAVEGADDMELSGRADPALDGAARRRPRPTPTSSSTSRRPTRRSGNVARVRSRPGVHAVVGTTGFDLDALRERGRGGAHRGRPTASVAPNFAIGAVLMMDSRAEARRAHARGRDRRAPPRRQARRALGHGEAHRRADRGGAAATSTSRSTRSGCPGLVAHQEVIFGGEGQTLSIRHDSIDRSSFMPGVLLAVRRVGELPEPFTVGLEPALDMAATGTQLALLDATAQAELVRTGEAIAGGAGRGGDRARRGAQPGAQRGHPPALRGGARRRRATRCRTGRSAACRSCFKDLGAALAGQPLHLGMQVLKDVDFRAPVDTYLGAALPRRRPGDDRQDQHCRSSGSCRPPSRTPTGRPATPGTRAAPPAARAAAPAAAVAAGMVPSRTPTTAAARSAFPPAHCGLVGLKPTRQRITEGR